MIPTFSATSMVCLPPLSFLLELDPSSRYTLLNTLEREFGESYPVLLHSLAKPQLVNKIRLLYDMPRNGGVKITTVPFLHSPFPSRESSARVRRSWHRRRPSAPTPTACLPR